MAGDTDGRAKLPLGAAPAAACAVASGLLYWAAFPGVDVWPLAFVAFVPLWVALAGQTPRRAAWVGLLAGMTMNFAGFAWLLGMLRTFSGFGTPLCLVFMTIVCAYQGGRFALMGWLNARARLRGWPQLPVFLAAFAVSELVYPLLFPWYFAATVHQIPALVQPAELGGPILVGVILVAVNLAIGEVAVALWTRRKIDRAPIVTGVAALAFDLVFSAWRIHAVDARAAVAPEAKVGLVQANMGLQEKRQDFGEGMRRHLDATRTLKQSGVDFVVWSETSAMRPVFEEHYKPEIRAGVGQRLGLPAIFGAVLNRPDPDPRRRYVFFNTALSSDARGEINGRYDKEYLLAFGEYIPFGDRFPALYEASPNSGKFSPGTELSPLTVETRDPKDPLAAPTKHVVAPLICYEDILPSFTNHAVRATDPELLVNMTNDAWFGASSEPWEHLALAELRAVEHRRYLIRSTNSGVSAIVDPVGRVLLHTTVRDVEKPASGPEGGRADTLVGAIRWMRGTTLYEIVGDVPWWLLAAATFGAAFVVRPRWPNPLAPTASF